MPKNCVVPADITLTSSHHRLIIMPVSVSHLEFTRVGSVRHGSREYDGKICERKSLESSTEPDS